MTRKSERELREEVERLSSASTGDTPTWTVEWRDPAPDENPDGLTHDRDTATITYDVWAAQRETLETLDTEAVDIVAFLAGYGAGKSLLGARWLLATALAHPESRFLAMGQDFTKARDSTHRILREQLPGEHTGAASADVAGPEGSPIVQTYDRQHNQLRLTNGSVIVLGSADTWERYASDEFGAVWLDEPSHYGEDLHKLLEMLGSRLRGVPGPHTQLWTLTGHGFNAAWEILKKRIDGDGNPIGLEIDLIRASTLDNPYLDQATKDRFKRQFGQTPRADQALHGKFAAAQDLVYSAFKRDVHVIDPATAEEWVQDDWRVYGYDAGWNNPRVCLEIGKTGYEQLVVLDAFYEHKSHVDDVIAWLEDEGKPEGLIFCDHVPHEIEKLKRTNWRAYEAEKDLDSGIAEVRRRLKPDGNQPIDEQPKLTSLTWDGGQECERVGLLVSERCRHLIREFVNYKEEDVGATDANDDCLDALRYAVMGVTDDTSSPKTISSSF